MSKGMLFSFFKAMNVHSGEGSLMANPKLKDSDFKGNKWTAIPRGIQCLRRAPLEQIVLHYFRKSGSCVNT
jgi:hypothetical protein